MENSSKKWPLVLVVALVVVAGVATYFLTSGDGLQGKIEKGPAITEKSCTKVFEDSLKKTSDQTVYRKCKEKFPKIWEEIITKKPKAPAIKTPAVPPAEDLAPVAPAAEPVQAPSAEESAPAEEPAPVAPAADIAPPAEEPVPEELAPTPPASDIVPAPPRALDKYSF